VGPERHANGDEHARDERDGLVIECCHGPLRRHAHAKSPEALSDALERGARRLQLVGRGGRILGQEAREIALGLDVLADVRARHAEVQEDARVGEELVGVDELLLRLGPTLRLKRGDATTKSRARLDTLLRLVRLLRSRITGVCG
jgi:hypothetical protein